ncbi:MAG: ATP-binding protein [Desulfomonilaceae bacterium]
MRYLLVPTTNVERFYAAANAVEARLSDKEIMGLGLVYGKPGLGKSMALEAYHTGQKRAGRVRTVPVRALAHWSPSSMLESLLRAVGQEPMAYRRNVMFDQLAEDLTRHPAVLLVDEVDAIAGHRLMISILKDIHDVTQSAVLMVGEDRVDGLLRRFESFYNRFNRSALVHLTHHTADDLRNVVQERCELPVQDEVCEALYKESGGKSMRSVIDRIREIERWCATNGIKEFGFEEWNRMTSRRVVREARPLTHAVRELGNA